MFLLIMLILLTVVFSIDSCRRIKDGVTDCDIAVIVISAIIIVLMYIRLLADLDRALGS